MRAAAWVSGQSGLLLALAAVLAAGLAFLFAAGGAVVFAALLAGFTSGSGQGHGGNGEEGHQCFHKFGQLVFDSVNVSCLSNRPGAPQPEFVPDCPWAKWIIVRHSFSRISRGTPWCGSRASLRVTASAAIGRRTRIQHAVGIKSAASTALGKAAPPFVAAHARSLKTKLHPVRCPNA